MSQHFFQFANEQNENVKNSRIVELTVAGKSTTAGIITSPAGTFSP